MNIAVLGANGRTGSLFVEEALMAGHTVRAGIHGDVNPFADAPRLEVVHCDAAKKAQLKKLLKGQDAVISLLGHTRSSGKTVQTDTMKALVEVMKELRIKRLISLTGTGVRFPGDQITLTDRLLNTGISIIDPSRVKDGRSHALVLQESKLEWTIVRVLKLTNGDPKPNRLSENGPTKSAVARREVAQAILQILEDNSFRHKAPIIAPRD